MTARASARVLWLLAALFALRVILQPAALVVDDGRLPSFESWHGGVLPYPLLLTAQILLLVWLCRTAWQIGTGAIRPDPWLGRLVVVFGTVYFVVMLARLVLGVTVLAHVRWFASPLPAFFHLVLAAYALIYGRFHVLGAEVAPARRPSSVAPATGGGSR